MQNELKIHVWVIMNFFSVSLVVIRVASLLSFVGWADQEWKCENQIEIVRLHIWIKKKYIYILSVDHTLDGLCSSDWLREQV